MKIDSWISRHVWSRFLVSSRPKRTITKYSSSYFTQRRYENFLWRGRGKSSTGEVCKVFRWALYLVLKFQRTGKTDHANIEIEWNHYKRTFIRIKWSWERHSCDADLSNCKLGVKKYFLTWMYININKQHWRNEHFLLYIDIGAHSQKNYKYFALTAERARYVTSSLFRLFRARHGRVKIFAHAQIRILTTRTFSSFSNSRICTSASGRLIFFEIFGDNLE